MMGHTRLQTNLYRALSLHCMTKFLTLILAAAAVPGALLISLPAHAAPVDATHQADTPRDGTHDFDFNFGVWHTHIRRAVNPFASSPEYVELNGTVTVRKVWGGRAQLEEIEADGPKGHWEGMTLFLYNPQSHQWSQTYIGARDGDMETPMIGEFKDGRGELISMDTSDGKTVIAKGVWSNIVPDSHRYEISYSDDGGKTYHVAFTADLTRISDSTSPDLHADAAPATSNADGQRDFDFDIGTWKTHSTRLLKPLTGSKTWVDMDGISEVKKVWGGRANLVEFSADGPAGRLEILAIRWFNPTTHEWSIIFANPGVGMLGVPGVGKFKDGRADLYDFEAINGRYVLVRFSIWGITPDTAQSEEAFSIDGGKTWEVHWINKYVRAGS
jgi:hypothetical protein